MKPIGKLDDYDRAFSRGTKQTAHDGAPGLAANFAKHNVHDPKTSIPPPPGKADTEKSSLFARLLTLVLAAATRSRRVAKRRGLFVARPGFGNVFECASFGTVTATRNAHGNLTCTYFVRPLPRIA